ncbi:MAG: sugar phosphate isomerase/epimerase [Lachnospiraceae bacterium]|nr:sugar phosphate isomerase/epimerase [Lachnospiraceae bacterium]
MAKILCSTGTMIGRPNGRDYRLIEKYAPQLQCDGFEFMMYSSWYEEVESLTDYLKSLKLYIPVVHVQKGIGEKISIGGQENFEEAYRLFEINCKLASDIDATKLVIHLWDGLPSDKQFENNVKAYPVLREIAEKYGLDLLVENVVCNQQDPLTHMIELAQEYPDIHYIFDTKMAAFHSQLDKLYDPECAWLWKDGHIRHYHVNDYGGGHMDWANLRTLPIGKGHIDFERFFDYIHEIGYDDTFTVEATAFDETGVVDVDMLNDQFSQIKKYLGK